MLDRLKWRWSFHYKECIHCWTKKHKHLSKGYCIKCFSQEPKRKQQLLNNREENQWKWQLKFYYKNKEVLNLISKINRRKKAWKPCLTIVIKWHERLMPFEWILEKPMITNKIKYAEYKKQTHEFKILKEYYENLYNK